MRPNTPEKKLVRTGQIATLVVVVIGIIWIPIMANISGVLYEYLQSVQSYIAPPITAVFLLGIFYRRINATASFVTLITGLIVGSLRIVLEIIKGSLDQDGLLFYLGDMNFLEFGAWFFLFCVILLLVVSLLTPEPSKEKTLNLTFSTITEEEKRNNKSSYNWKDIVITIVVIIIVAGIMIFFNGN